MVCGTGQRGLAGLAVPSLLLCVCLCVCVYVQAHTYAHTEFVFPGVFPAITGGFSVLRCPKRPDAAGHGQNVLLSCPPSLG